MENTKSEKELRPDEFFSRGFLSFSAPGRSRKTLARSSSSIGRALWEHSKAICMMLMMEVSLSYCPTSAVTHKTHLQHLNGRTRARNR